MDLFGRLRQGLEVPPTTNLPGGDTDDLRRGLGQRNGQQPAINPAATLITDALMKASPEQLRAVSGFLTEASNRGQAISPTGAGLLQGMSLALDGLANAKGSPLGQLFPGMIEKQVNSSVTAILTKLQEEAPQVLGEIPDALRRAGIPFSIPVAPSQPGTCVEPPEGSGLPRCVPLFGDEELESKGNPPTRPEPLW